MLGSSKLPKAARLIGPVLRPLTGLAIAILAVSAIALVGIAVATSISLPP